MPRCPPAASSGASFFSIRSSMLMTRNPAAASFCAQCDFPAPDIPIRDNLITYPRWCLLLPGGSVRPRLHFASQELIPLHGGQLDFYLGDRPKRISSPDAPCKPREVVSCVSHFRLYRAITEAKGYVVFGTSASES